MVATYKSKDKSLTEGKDEIICFPCKYPCLTISSILTLIGWSLVFVLGAFDWPEPRQDKDVCFETYLTKAECMCEALRADSLIAQPANTFSNLAYSIGGLVVAWSGDTRRFPSLKLWENSNLITHQAYFSYSYSIVLINISYSSAFMHAGWTVWGGKLDILSILLWMGWVALYSICKLVLIWKGGWSVKRFKLATKVHAVSFLNFAVAVFIIWFSVKVATSVQNYLLYSFSIIILVEAYCFCKTNDRKRRGFIFMISVCLFVTGFLFQMFTKGGSSFCNPDQFVQGHAFWHVLSAAASTTLYFYFLSDKLTHMSVDIKAVDDDENDNALTVDIGNDELGREVEDKVEA